MQDEQIDLDDRAEEELHELEIREQEYETYLYREVSQDFS